MISPIKFHYRVKNDRPNDLVEKQALEVIKKVNANRALNKSGFDLQAVVFIMDHCRMMEGEIGIQLDSNIFWERRTSSVTLRSLDIFWACLKSTSFGLTSGYKFQESAQFIEFETQESTTKILLNLMSPESRQIEVETYEVESIQFLQAAASFYKLAMQEFWVNFPGLKECDEFRKNIFLIDFLENYRDC